MAKRGLPTGISMRHDSHYVEDLARTNRTVGRIIPISQIEPNPDQPRVEIGDLTELANSIKEKGVLEPLLVKPNPENRTWMIIAGERRWRAANIAGLIEVPCIELDIDEKSVAEIALIENLQRKDLTIWEEADGFAALAKRYGYKHDEIAKKIGKSRSSVTEAMAIAGLPTEIRQRCLDAKISSKSTLLEISRQFDDQSMHELLDNILSKNLKREDVRQIVRPPQTQVKEHTPLLVSAQEDAAKADSNQPDSGYHPSPLPSVGETSINVQDNSSSYNKKTFQYANKNKTFSLELRFHNKQNFYDSDDVRSALEEVLKSLPK